MSVMREIATARHVGCAHPLCRRDGMLVYDGQRWCAGCFVVLMIHQDREERRVA